MQKITPNLWFNTNAEEAVAFYTRVFRNGQTHTTTRYPSVGQEVHGMPAGSVLTISFEIEGYQFLALNGGPLFTFNPSISFMVHCTSPEEVDELFGALSEGGMALMPLDAYPFSPRYGWIQDAFGVSWQIIYREGNSERKIIPSLLFVGDVCGRAEEAIDRYVSIFPDSKKGTMHRYPAGQEHDKEGTIMHGGFTLCGQEFSAMDSAHPAHAFTFNEAISLIVECADQQEIDSYWEQLSAVTEAEQCGWLKDTFGVSWQITPRGMETFLNDPDTEKVNRVMAALLSMKKINIAELEAAAAA